MAVLALVVALGGRAVVASRYAVGSTRELRPAVIGTLTSLALTRQVIVSGPIETVAAGYKEPKLTLSDGTVIDRSKTGPFADADDTATR